MIPPLFVKILGKDGVSGKLAGIQRKLNKFGTAATKVGTTMSVGLSAPMGLFAVNTLRTAGEFEYGMNRVSAITSAVGKDFDMLRGQAKHLGETTTFTAGQVTEGMQMLAQAGMEPIDIYNSIGTVLKGAQANMVDMASTANIGAGLMKTFGYESKEMMTVMDMLTKTSMSSMTNFTELSEAFLYAGPTAGAMGRTLKETSGVLGVLANGMMKSSMAGTSLRGMMAKLTAPSKEAIGIMASLGIKYDDILDSKGNLRSFIDVIKAFEKTGITAGQVLEIFGLRAGPGFQILLNQGSKALQEMTDKIGDFGGVTEKISNVQMAGFKGQMWALTSAFEGFQIAIADSGILMFATKFAKKVTRIFQAFAKANPKLLKFSFILGLIVAAVGPLLLIVGAISAAIAAISTPVLIAIGVITGLITVLTTVYFWGGKIIEFFAKWGWVVGLLMGPVGWLLWATALLANNWDEVTASLKIVYDWFVKIFNKISDSKLGKFGKFIGSIASRLGEGINNAAQDQANVNEMYYNMYGVNKPKAQINVNIPNAPRGTEVTVESEDIDASVDQGVAFGY